MTLAEFRYLAADTGSGFSSMGYTTADSESVLIGSQEWEIVNLNVTTYSDGTIIPQVTDPTAWEALTTGAWCYYDNNTFYGGTSSNFKKLYNWYAVAGIYDAASYSNPTLRKKLAPNGWHLPTNAEWTTLINYLGGESVAGDALKDTGDMAGTNTSGFTALGAGLRDDAGTFSYVDIFAYFWNAEEYNSDNAYFRYLTWSSNAIARSSAAKTYGFSVRCIKDIAPSETVLLYNLDAAGTARVEAVAIRTANYNLTELNRVTMINLTPSGSTTMVNIPISDSDAPYRRIEKNVSGPYFIYAISPQSQQPVISTPVSGSTGTATGGNSSSITGSATYALDTLKGLTVKLTSGTGIGQARRITSNTGSILTVSPNWTTTPVSASTGYTIFGIPQFTTKLFTEYLSTSLRHQAIDYELLSNVDINNQSTSIYKADTSTQSSTGNGLISSRKSPINLSSILSGQSPFASVQDSNYSSTPWKNARYDGSIITPSNNQGYPPFTHGTFLEGLFFSKETADSYIDNLISTSNVEYKQYFSISDLDVPQYTTIPLNLVTTSDTSISSSIIQLTTNDIETPLQDINTGDILFLQLNDTTYLERLQVVAPNPPGAYSPYEFIIRTPDAAEFSSIKVARGYSNTTRESYPISSSLSRIVPVRILELAKSTLVPVTEGKFRIKGRGDTLHLSIDGYIISGSGTSGI